MADTKHLDMLGDDGVWKPFSLLAWSKKPDGEYPVVLRVRTDKPWKAKWNAKHKETADNADENQEGREPWPSR